jgi:tetratricopeptide (TPR) repeat protein
VFAASLLFQLLILAIGQGAAVYYLRTGRFWVGCLSTAALWAAFDWWLLQRYVLATGADALWPPASTLQAVALATVLALAFGLWRRRFSAVARARAAHFGDGMASFLRGDHDAARATFGRLVAADPWDAAAWVALGDVWQGCGQFARARRCWRRAAAVDTRGVYEDLLRLRTGAASWRGR